MLHSMFLTSEHPSRKYLYNAGKNLSAFQKLTFLIILLIFFPIPSSRKWFPCIKNTACILLCDRPIYAFFLSADWPQTLVGIGVACVCAQEKNKFKKVIKYFWPVLKPSSRFLYDLIHYLITFFNAFALIQTSQIAA